MGVTDGVKLIVPDVEGDKLCETEVVVDGLSVGDRDGLDEAETVGEGLVDRVEDRKSVV